MVAGIYPMVMDAVSQGGFQQHLDPHILLRLRRAAFPKGEGFFILLQEVLYRFIQQAGLWDSGFL